MSSPNHSTSDIEDAFSSMNILNYTSVSSDYFPASSESRSFNSSENSTDNIIPPVFLFFHNNPCLKDVQAFYAKELPISSPDPITSPAILTPSPILSLLLLFDPRYFFIPEELLPPKKQIHSPSSSSTTLFNSSQNQTCDLVSPSSSIYTPTPPQVFEIGKCSDKMYLKHHEKQVEDILNYLDKLYLHHIEKIEEGRIDRMIIQRNSDCSGSSFSFNASPLTFLLLLPLLSQSFHLIPLCLSKSHRAHSCICHDKPLYHVLAVPLITKQTFG
ncbi:hypothetical protein Tco_0174030 [Tanacetum coccineum]